MRPAPTEAVQSGRALRFAHRLYALGPLVGLIVLCIVGTLLNRDFATLDNMMNVLTRTSFIGIIAVGMTFVIISGGIDLSVGSMAALIASNGRIVFSLAVGIRAGRAFQQQSLRRGSLHCRAPKAWCGSSAGAIATIVSPRHCLRRLDRTGRAQRLIQPG